MAAFIGTIGAKFLTISLRLTFLFYLYASIQPLFFLFDSQLLGPTHDVAVTCITMLAFILKVVLYLTVTWIQRTGRLCYIIAEARSLYENRDDKFQQFKNSFPLISKG